MPNDNSRARELAQQRSVSLGEAAWLQVAAVIAIVVILHVPLGNYLARVYTATTSWRMEEAVYRAVGVEPDHHQLWTKYQSSLLAFSLVSVLLLYALLLVQVHLPDRGAMRE
ncbi:MAG: potassium-transporting ATPase potassium-binding subunit [Mycobacterium sp.]|nr:potassium-transporting ATPase potassium-binding subunit [Mycobacterium sp.]